MDLRTYYQKIRDLEATIPAQFAVVLSRSTGDGGKGGIPVEVTRHVAAKMMAEGTAELASMEQTAAFQQAQAAAQIVAQEAAAAAKVVVTMVSPDDLKKLKSGSKAARE